MKGLIHHAPPKGGLSGVVLACNTVGESTLKLWLATTSQITNTQLMKSHVNWVNNLLIRLLISLSKTELLLYPFCDRLGLKKGPQSHQAYTCTSIGYVLSIMLLSNNRSTMPDKVSHDSQSYFTKMIIIDYYFASRAQLLFEVNATYWFEDMDIFPFI